MTKRCRNKIYDNRHLEAKKILKVNWKHDEYKIGYCPSCTFNDNKIHQLVCEYQNYCPNCGQELDWNE